MSKTYLQEKIEFNGLSSGTNYYITFDSNGNLEATTSIIGVKRQLKVNTTSPDTLTVTLGGNAIPRYNTYKETDEDTTYHCIYELDSAGSYVVSGVANPVIFGNTIEQKSVTVS